jgi:hypothetical protein
MKKQLNKDFICICGHKRQDHYLKEKACWFCAISGPWCDKFVGDNLKYLESKI